MSSTLSQSSLHELLATYSAPAPAPAGISGSALGATVGAALILKAARITERRLTDEARRETVAMIASKVERLRNMLEEIVDQDAKAYTKLVRVKSAYAKGLESDIALENALKTVTLIPGAMGRAAMICINLARELADLAYPAVLSDLAMGAWLCYAAVEASLLALQHNLEEITDQSFCNKIRSKLDFFEQREALVQQVTLAAVKRRQMVAAGNRDDSRVDE